MKLSTRIPLLIGAIVLITSACIIFITENLVSNEMQKNAFSETATSAVAAAEQLETVLERTRSFQTEQAAGLYRILAELREKGISFLKNDELSDMQRDYVRKYFDDEILPVSIDLIDFDDFGGYCAQSIHYSPADAFAAYSLNEHSFNFCFFKCSHAGEEISGDHFRFVMCAHNFQICPMLHMFFCCRCYKQTDFTLIIKVKFVIHFFKR